MWTFERKGNANEFCHEMKDYSELNDALYFSKTETRYIDAPPLLFQFNTILSFGNRNTKRSTASPILSLYLNRYYSFSAVLAIVLM